MPSDSDAAMTPQPQPAPSSRELNAPARDATPPPARRRKLLLIVLAVVIAGAVIAWRTYAGRRSLDAVITLSGRIEADESRVAPKLSGRILEIRQHEGDMVKAGDVIAVLDDDQIRAREDQARAALMQTEARARAARDQIAVLQQQLRQAELHTQQSRVDATGRVKQAEADLAAAEAQLAQQQASYRLALFDKEAYEKLA